MCGEERFEKRIYMTRSRNKFQNILRETGKKYFFGGKTVCLCCAFMIKAGEGGESIAVSERLFPQTFPLPPPPPYIPQIAPSTSFLFRRDPLSPSSFSLLLCLPPFPSLSPCGFWFCEPKERIDYFAKSPLSQGTLI